MLLEEIVETSDAVTSTSARSEKIELLANVLRRLDPAEAAIGVSYLAGSPTQRKLGAGPATVYGMEEEPATTPTLQIVEVDDILEKVAETSGAGSKSRREALLRDLLGRATKREQEYLRGLMVRNLRQGALEGVMAEAVAAALGVDPVRVRRAAMLEGDLVAVSARALTDGPESLTTVSMEVGVPVQPMLARTAESAGGAVEELGEGVVERKLDGLRLQVHRRGDEARVFTRNLRDVTDEVPAVRAAALRLKAGSFILDGEGLVVGPDGSPMSFQDSMSRPDDRGGHPLTAFYFDVLHLDGVDLVDSPLSERRQAMERFIPSDLRVGSIVTSDPGAADAYFEASVAKGFEGVVVKDLTQPYEAGRRGSGWLKVKPTHTLDLVVLAAEWGSGRRQGWLSNLHLGAVGPDGGYVMLGKTFKGLTDEMLEWQTAAFLEIEGHRSGRTVFLKPEIVYEIAFDGVQRSTRYPGGVTLRFARVKGVRDDKDPKDADTLETVRSFLR
ncbi:MAG TPA: ATP-dependent DNA ligase [Acidimicrobiia bacterium]